MPRLLLHTAPSPAEDLALEESIHQRIEEDASPDTWRLWSARVPAVILGTGQEAAREANLDNTRAENAPVLRRHSGGGAVVIGPGTINFSAFFRYENLPGSHTIHGATYSALQTILDLLKPWKIEARIAGSSDMAILGPDGTMRKIAGNSQARKKRSVVVHGTLLADPDWSRLERLLKFPTSIPDYRAGRSHREFLTSLKECGAPFSLEEFTDALAHQLPGDTVRVDSPTEKESAGARELLDQKYSTAEWNFRR